MKLLYTLIILFCLSSLSASEWLYYKHFPWVYDNKTEGWLYLKAGSDGQIYAYINNTGIWEVFKVEEETHAQQEEETPIVITDDMTWDEKYEIWIQNPEPYGGLAMLQRIKDARESNATELDLGGYYNISDLTPLAGAGLTNLERLYLEYNNVSDLTPLAEITSLTAIDFYGNNISDLTPLVGLTNLNWLSLEANSISDLTPLVGLTNLATLFLANNDISDSQKAMLRGARPYVQVSWY